MTYNNKIIAELNRDCIATGPVTSKRNSQKIKVVTNKKNTPTCSQMRVYSEKKCKNDQRKQLTNEEIN